MKLESFLVKKNEFFYVIALSMICANFIAFAGELDEKIEQVLMDCSKSNIFEPDAKCLRKGLIPSIPLDAVPGCSKDLATKEGNWSEKNTCLRNVVRLSCGRKSYRLLNGCGATTVPRYENICLEILLQNSCNNPLPHMRHDNHAGQ